MDEKVVIKKSLYVFLAGSIIFAIVGLLFQDISYVLGFALGYVIGLIAFLIVIKTTDSILKLSMSAIIVMFGFLIKLALYALGMIIAVKSPWFHLVGVFLGYMVTKVTIFSEGYVERRR